MNPRSAMGLRGRLLLLVGLTLLPAFALSLYNGLEARQAAADAAKNEALRLTHLAAANQERLIGETRQLLAAVALLDEVQTFDLEAASRLFARLLTLQPYSANLGLIDSQGFLVASGLSFEAPMDLSDRTYFTRAMSSGVFAIGEYQVGRVTGIPTINVGVPVRGEAGELIGVVYAALSLEWINEYAAVAGLPEGSTATILDRKGTILARYPESDGWISQTFSDVPLFDFLRENPGENTLESEGLDGVVRLIAYLPIHPEIEADAYVIVGIPASVAYAQVSEAFIRTLAGLSSILLLGGTAAAVGAQLMLVRPARRFADTATRISEGDFDARTEIATRGDELGHLADAIDRMAESLGERVSELEAARDHLTRLNRFLQVLSAGNRAVVHADNEPKLLADMCRVLLDIGGFVVAWIGYLDFEDRSVRMVQGAGLGTNETDSFRQVQDNLDRQQGPGWEAIQSGQPYLLNNIYENPQAVAWRSEALACGYQSFVLVPLTDRASPAQGLLMVCASSPTAFHREELDIIEELADDLTFGIVSLRERARRRKVEHEIRKLKEFHEGILLSMREGIVVEDAEGVMTFVNPASESILGYSQEELVGKHRDFIVPEDQREKVQDADQRRREGEGDQYELELMRKDGERIQVLVSAVPVFEMETYEGSIAVFTDITAFMEAERIAERRERLASIGQLAAGIAHDFNNILGTITLYSELVQSQADLSPENQERLNTVIQQGRRGAELITQILDFSRRSVVERYPTDLRRMMFELKALLDRTLTETIEIDLQISEEDLVVQVDPTRIQQMIMNLSFNARDAMPEGGRLTFDLSRIKVELGSQPFQDMEEGDWVRLQVVDTGVGIPVELRSRIFEPFFTTKPEGKGTGLGLAQVYGILKQHGGFIDVQSQPGQGSSFIVYLPANVLPSSEPGADPLQMPPQDQGRTILLVSDDAGHRRAIAAILSPLGFKVLEADSGQTALRLLEEQPGKIAVVLSDFMISDMGGSSYITALQQKDPQARIVVMTEYPVGKGTGPLLDRRTLVWLFKPITRESIAKALEEALG